MDSHERQWKRAVREDEALAFMIPFVWISLWQLIQTQGIFVFLSTLLTGIFVQVLKAKNKTKRSRASPKYNKRRGKRGGGGDDLKNGEHARDRVTSRKGGTNAGGGGHREGGKKKGSTGIQTRKEASNRERPPDFFRPCLSFAPIPAVPRLWRDLFLQLITILQFPSKMGQWFTAPSEAEELPGAKDYGRQQVPGWRVGGGHG